MLLSDIGSKITGIVSGNALYSNKKVSETLPGLRNRFRFVTKVKIRIHKPLNSIGRRVPRS